MHAQQFMEKREAKAAGRDGQDEYEDDEDNNTYEHV